MGDDAKNRRELVVIMKSPEGPKDKWDKVERLSRTFSLAAIPVVLAIGGWIIQGSLQSQTVSRDYVQIAVAILSNSDKQKVPPELRVWAVDLLNENSPVEFSPEVAQKLKSGEATLPGITKFGEGGTINTEADKDSITLNLDKGERVSFIVDAEGIRPNFVVACNHESSQMYMTEESPTPKTTRFRMNWPAMDPAKHGGSDELRVSAPFAGASKYTLLVERRDKDGNVLEVIKNKTFQSAVPNDVFNETLQVKIVR